jgi:hypothetical protein
MAGQDTISPGPPYTGQTRTTPYKGVSMSGRLSGGDHERWVVLEAMVEGVAPRTRLCPLHTTGVSYGGRMEATARTSATTKSRFVAICGVVSIPAPARGATPSVTRMVISIGLVAIPAPAWGVTNATILCARGSSCFNPHARRGHDASSAWQHAPRSSFNPRARRGRDMPDSVIQTRRFQSTHPHGVRIAVPKLRCALDDVSIQAPLRGRDQQMRASIAALSFFNPRARMGRDPRVLHDVSIRVPHGRDQLPPLGCFNPRALMRCNASLRFDVPTLRRFNPRARIGPDEVRHLTRRDAKPSIHEQIEAVFQSPRPQGARPGRVADGR